MNNVETKLKELILNRYGSLAKFCEKIGIPWTTLDSILKRGVEKANILNILKITRELGLDVEALASGEIVFRRPDTLAAHFDGDTLAAHFDGDTLAAHFDGDTLTPEEQEEVDNFVEYVKSKRS